MAPTPPPTVDPPRRLFRLGALAAPLVPLPAPPDRLFAGSAVVCCSTRRAALLEALGPGAAGDPGVEPEALALLPVRLDDARPVLDLRDAPAPATLPPALATCLANHGAGPEGLAAALAWAGETDLAGVAWRSRFAPTQICWAFSLGAPLVPLAAPRPLSRHDPDLVAARRLLGKAPMGA